MLSGGWQLEERSYFWGGNFAIRGRVWVLLVRCTLPRLLFPVFEQDFFREIQESVRFLRNPQDFKIPAGKRKNVNTDIFHRNPVSLD